MNRRHFLALLGGTALTSTLVAPQRTHRVLLSAPAPRTGPLCVGPFTETTVAETWYMEDGRVLNFPSLEGHEWRT